MIYVYRITNITNGRYYIGVHKTEDRNDGYMGSGVAIKRALEKYGIESFKKEILEEFETYEEAFLREKELIDLSDPLCYNLNEGGKGGFEYIRSLNLPNPMKNPETVEKNLASRKTTYEANKDFYNEISRNNLRKSHEAKIGKKDTPETIEKRKQSLLKFYKENESPLKGIPFSEEHKKKLSDGWTKEKRKKKSQQQKERIAKDPDCVKGALGKKHNLETRKKLSEARRAYLNSIKEIIIICPHCSKSGSSAGMKRWHFNNCKERK